jgi:hypothetical protein
MIRSSLPWLLALTLLVSLSPSGTALPAFADQSVAMPFPGGKAVRIIQGYQGGTHQGRSQYGLDIVLADGKTGGAEVVSPIEGTVTWAQSPNAGNGCIAIAMRNGNHSIMMCHIVLNRAYKGGESIAHGQSLGTVGADGTVGNNGVAHIHLELHSGGRASNPVPFAEPDGLLLEGESLPASSTTAVVSKRGPIVSSNRPGSGPAPSTAVAQRNTERTEKMSETSGTSETAILAAASVPATLRSVQPPGSTTATATRRAIVHGTESCLKVRKQPATDGAVVGCLKEGSEISLRALSSSADAKWRQIDQGWVSSEYLKRTQAIVSGTDACLNVREDPKANAAKLGCLPDGTAVTIAEGPSTTDGQSWYRIEPTGSLTRGGWVVGEHLD